MRIRFGLVVLAMVGMAVLAPITAHAESPAPLPLLAPAGELDAVRCRMLVVTSRLKCGATDCHWFVEQEWAIENTDKRQDRALTLSLRDVSNIVSPSFTDEQGNVLTPQQTSGNLTWSLVMRAGKRATLRLTYETAGEASHFCHWSLSGDTLSRWGGIDGARIAVALPDPILEDSLIAIAPSNYALAGRELSWEYENRAAYPEHVLVMVAAQTRSSLESLQTANEHLAVAELLQEMGETAERLGVVWHDTEAEISAELQLAKQAQPASTRPLWALANHYTEQRLAHPERAHNYLVLAANALADIVILDPSDAAARQRLARLYMEASQEASQSGDLVGALHYMQLAKDMGAGTAQTAEDQHVLALQLAVAIAKQGQPGEALASIGSALTPATQDDIAHYAPPFAAAETRLTYGPSASHAETRLQLYAPLREQSLRHIAELVATIDALDGTTALVDTEGNTCTVRVTQSLASAQQQQAARDTLAQALSDDADMLACLLALPWSGEAPTLAVLESPWVRRLSLSSVMDSTPLAALYANQSDYAGWRMAEIRAKQAETTIAQLERELVLAALDEQVTIWRQLPASSYWVVEVDTGAFKPERRPRWVVGWNQAKPLELYVTEYRWGAIAATAGAALAFFAFLALAALWGRNPRS